MGYTELFLSRMITDLVNKQDREIFQDISGQLFHTSGFNTIIIDSSGAVSACCCDERLHGLIGDVTAAVKGCNSFTDNMQLEPGGSVELYITVYPLLSSGSYLGMFIVFKDIEFSTDDLVQLNYIASIILLLHQKQNKEWQGGDDLQSAKKALHSLSYSELKATSAIMSELNASEGRVVAKKISDEHGVTRSAIVNALRKLESAGILEARSLGTKGTYIKILNTAIAGEIKKL